MQLVKLIYFAQGWYLAFVGKPITSHKAHAWQYGPVYPLVYKAFPGAGSRPLDGLITDKITAEPYRANFTDDEEALIEWIVDEYGKLHAFDLSRRTHADDGPWKAAIDRSGTYSEIPDSDLQSYFRQFVRDDA
ncbi:Panacea domain-containing protein [Phenylobacterium sp.]|uniref:Panacea domain-containing protein n=1 Tax=Phenylobacterium sp. TaxID=1871053 RepID=UPI00301E60B3